MLDPAPRVVLDPQLGFAAAGRDAREAAIIEELYDHSIDVILRAEALGGWRGVGESHLFDIEYWDLEQAKLRKAGRAAGVQAARWRWSPAPRPASARPASTLSCGAAPRWSAWTAIPRSRPMWQRPDFLGVALRSDRRRRGRPGLEQGGACIRRRRHAGAERRHLPHVRAAAGHRRRRLAARP